MKKLIIGFLAIVIVAIVVLGGLFFQNYTVLHISPTVCGYFFEDVSPQAFCETEGKDTWLENKYLFARVDEDGCLILLLRKSTINEWKNTFTDLQILQCVLGDSRDLGIHVDDSQDSLDLMKDAHTCGFEISEDYKQFIESPEDNGWYFPFVMSGCIKMQVFNGVPCSEIRVEYLEIDAEGKILDKVVFPDDVEDNADLSD